MQGPYLKAGPRGSSCGEAGTVVAFGWLNAFLNATATTAIPTTTPSTTPTTPPSTAPTTPPSTAPTTPPSTAPTTPPSTAPTTNPTPRSADAVTRSDGSGGDDGSLGTGAIVGLVVVFFFVVLLGFGLAKRRRDGGPKRTNPSGTAIPNPVYAAPDTPRTASPDSPGTAAQPWEAYAQLGPLPGTTGRRASSTDTDGTLPRAGGQGSGQDGEHVYTALGDAGPRVDDTEAGNTPGTVAQPWEAYAQLTPGGRRSSSTDTDMDATLRREAGGQSQPAEHVYTALGVAETRVDDRQPEYSHLGAVAGAAGARAGTPSGATGGGVVTSTEPGAGTAGSFGFSQDDAKAARPESALYAVLDGGKVDTHEAYEELTDDGGIYSNPAPDTSTADGSCVDEACMAAAVHPASPSRQPKPPSVLRPPQHGAGTGTAVDPDEQFDYTAMSSPGGVTAGTAEPDYAVYAVPSEVDSEIDSEMKASSMYQSCDRDVPPRACNSYGTPQDPCMQDRAEAEAELRGLKAGGPGDPTTAARYASPPAAVAPVYKGIESETQLNRLGAADRDQPEYAESTPMDDPSDPTYACVAVTHPMTHPVRRVAGDPGAPRPDGFHPVDPVAARPHAVDATVAIGRPTMPTRPPPLPSDGDGDGDGNDGGGPMYEAIDLGTDRAAGRPDGPYADLGLADNAAAQALAALGPLYDTNDVASQLDESPGVEGETGAGPQPPASAAASTVAPAWDPTYDNTDAAPEYTTPPGYST